jgi:nicotinamide riboside kinase
VSEHAVEETPLFDRVVEEKGFDVNLVTNPRPSWNQADAEQQMRQRGNGKRERSTRSKAKRPQPA